MWFIGHWNWDTCDELRGPDILCNSEMMVRSTTSSDFPRRNSVYFPAIRLSYGVMWGPAVMSHSLLLHDRQHRRVTCWTMYQNSFVLLQSDTDPYTIEVCWSHDMKFHLIPSSSRSFSFYPPKLCIYVSFHFRHAIFPGQRRDTIVFCKSLLFINIPTSILTLYVPYIILKCVDKPTRCSTSYEWSLFSIIWLYMFRTITSPSSGASSHKLYNPFGTSWYSS